MKPNWLVLYFDSNNQIFRGFDIFSHSSFAKEFSELKKDNFESFQTDLMNLIKYYFWAKCEYELVLGDWPCGEVSRKIDVYTQLVTNWDRFAEYCFQEFDF